MTKSREDRERNANLAVDYYKVDGDGAWVYRTVDLSIRYQITGSRIFAILKFLGFPVRTEVGSKTHIDEEKYTELNVASRINTYLTERG